MPESVQNLELNNTIEMSTNEKLPSEITVNADNKAETKGMVRKWVNGRIVEEAIEPENAGNINEDNIACRWNEDGVVNNFVHGAKVGF